MTKTAKDNSKIWSKINSVAKTEINPVFVVVICTAFAVALISFLDGLAPFSKDFWIVIFLFYSAYDVMAFHESNQKLILIQLAHWCVFLSFFVIGIGAMHKVPILLAIGFVIFTLAGFAIVLIRLAQCFWFIVKALRKVHN